MNGYAVYKVQTRSSIKDKQVKEKVPSPVCSLIGKIVTQFILKFKIKTFISPRRYIPPAALGVGLIYISLVVFGK